MMSLEERVKSLELELRREIYPSAMGRLVVDFSPILDMIHKIDGKLFARERELKELTKKYTTLQQNFERIHKLFLERFDRLEKRFEPKEEIVVEDKLTITKIPKKEEETEHVDP